MSKRLTFLLPMGGLGSRFAEAGFTLPKPLIPIDGMPMFQKAMSSLSSDIQDIDIVCVIRQEHVDEFALDKKITAIEPRATVVVIPKLTQGAAETAYLAKEVVDPNSVLIILDCDLMIQSSSYIKKLKELLSGSRTDLSGILPVVKSQSPNYSYVQTDESGKVLKTAEKIVISDLAIAGGYCFSSAKLFFDYAKKLLELPVAESCTDTEHLQTAVRKEYYISYIFSLMLRDGLLIEIAPIDVYYSFGTPKELQAYEQSTDTSQKTTH
jgi:NDP-sugar pyrophosphorylase family protein